MGNNDKIIKNLRIGKYIILITNLISAIIFLFVYSSLKNVLILYVVILLLVVAFAIYIYFNHVEKKFSKMKE